jgi:hypothetical protein
VVRLNRIQYIEVVPPASSPERERASLEAALLREIAATWREIVSNHFRGALRAPVFAFADSDGRLGCWHREGRTISLSRKLVFEQPWGVVREVLRHEIAHQFVDESLRVHDETAHGPAFTRVCREHGIDASAAGLPNATGPDGQSPQHPQHPMLRRIMRLLALAESPNLHEAEAAMNEARRLMLAHNIDASAATASEGYHVRHVGPVKARTEASERILAGILGRHFFVSVIWVPSYVAREARTGYTLELCGTAANLAVAEHVHAFLTETAQRLWRDHKRAQGIRFDRERRSYCAGVMAGFQEKLDEGERQSQEQGLVLHADAARDAFLARRYPRTRMRSERTSLRPEAYESGRAAGRQVELHRPVSAEAARGRLLGPVGT